MRSMIKKVICSLLVIVFIISSANVAFAVEFEYPERQLMYPKRYNASLTNVDGLNAYFDLKKFNDYVVEQLYMVDGTIEKGVIDLSQFSIPGSKTEDMAELIWYNSPELFPINGLSFSVKTGVNPSAPDAEYIDALYFSSPYTQEESKKMHTKMVSNAEVLLYGVKNNSSLSELEKALILHDRLISFNEYDYENYESGVNNIPDESYNAYGALGLGVSVCMGYTLAYDYLLEQVGIKSDYCSSDTLNHAWNVVYIDGKPYHVDTTWDDPVLDVTGRVWHDNFLRSTEGIKATGHNADDFTTSPVDTTYDSYFWQNMRASFEVIGSKLYYFDEADKKIYAANDISNIKNKTSLETIDDLSSCKWFGGYTTMANTKLGSAYGLLYYTAPNAIYCYDPSTKKITTVLTPEEVLADIANYDSDFSIAGMNVFGCVISGEYYNDDFYDNLSVKKNYCFKITTHQKSTEWVVVTPATTTTSGKKILKCTKCNENIKTEEIPVVSEHTCNWSDWETVVTATCSTEGKQISKCSICYEEKTQTLKKLEHNFTEHTIQATCNATGLKYKECSVCKTKVTLETIAATGEHKASTDWMTGKVATCGSEGYDYLPCVTCGAELERKTTAQLPHGETELADVKAATCTQEGYSGNQRCKTCKTVISYGTKTAKAAHKSSDWIIEKIATITQDGAKYRKCTVCGERLETVVIPKLTHKSDGGTITKQPTCAEAGIKTFKCTKCGEVIKTESIPATGAHNSNTKLTGKAATCTEAGLTDGKKCSVCGKVTKAQETIAKKGHTEVIIPKVAPTLTSTGLTEGKKCSVCGTVTVSQQVIAKLVLVAPVITSITSTTGGVKFTWGAVPYAAKYKIYRKTYHPSTGKWDSKWKKINKVEVKGTEYVDGTAKLGTQYMYLIKAVNGKATKNSAASSAITFKISPTPTAYLKSNGIKVKWPETVVSAESYRIYRADFNEATGKYNSYKKVKTVKGTTKSWTDTTVVSGKKYKYCVKAVRGSVVCDKVQTKSMYFLTKPTAKATKTANGIVVGWNQIQGATSFKIYRASFQNGAWTGYSHIATVGPTTSYLDSATVPGVQYKYKVKAVKSKTGVTSSETAAVIR